MNEGIEITVCVLLITNWCSKLIWSGHENVQITYISALNGNMFISQYDTLLDYRKTKIKLIWETSSETLLLISGIFFSYWTVPLADRINDYHSMSLHSYVWLISSTKPTQFFDQEIHLCKCSLKIHGCGLL